MDEKMIETLYSLVNREDWGDVEKFLNIILNLLHEDYGYRRSAGKYYRVFTIGKLKITVDFREQNYGN